MLRTSTHANSLANSDQSKEFFGATSYSAAVPVLRPANALGKIGDEYVIESEEDCKKNTEGLLQEFARHRKHSEDNGIDVETALVYFMKVLKLDYNRGRITQNAYVAVQKKLNSFTREENVKNYQALGNAIKNKDERALVEFLKSHADISSLNEKGETPLHLAVSHAPEFIAKLIEHGANKDAVREQDGFTPLHLACSSKNPTAVKQLRKAGARYNILDKKDRPPIFYAIKDFETTKTLVENGIDLNHLYSNNKVTVLAYAGMTKAPIHVVNFLLENGANPNTLLGDGRGISYAYLLSNHPESIPSLISHNADFNFTDPDGDNAIGLAIFGNNLDTLETLLKLKVAVHFDRILALADYARQKGQFTHSDEALISLINKYHPNSMAMPTDSKRTLLFSFLILVGVFLAAWFGRLVLNGTVKNKMIAIKDHYITWSELNYFTKGILKNIWRHDYYNFNTKLDLDYQDEQSKRIAIKALKIILEKNVGPVTITENTIRVRNTFDLARGRGRELHEELRQLIAKEITHAQTRREKKREDNILAPPKSNKKLEALKTQLSTLKADVQAFDKARIEMLKQYQDTISNTESRLRNLPKTTDIKLLKIISTIESSQNTLKNYKTEIESLPLGSVESDIPSLDVNLQQLDGIAKTEPMDESRFAELSTQTEATISTHDAQVSKFRKHLSLEVLNDLSKKIDDEFSKLARAQQNTRPGKVDVTPKASLLTELPFVAVTRPNSPAPVGVELPIPTITPQVEVVTRLPAPVIPDTRHLHTEGVMLTPSKPATVLQSAVLFPPVLPQPESKSEKIKLSPKRHAKAALHYALNMSSLLDDLFRDDSKLSQSEQLIYLNGLLYNLLRTCQSLWDAASFSSDKHKIERMIAKLRHLIVHKVTLQAGSQINLNHIVSAALQIREQVLPILQDVVKQKNEGLILEKTPLLAKKLKRTIKDSFAGANFKLKYSHEECISEINGCVANILDLSKVFANSDQMTKNPHRTAAIKLLVVRIGEYWRLLCENYPEQRDHHVGCHLDLNAIEECVRYRNMICHETHEGRDSSYMDINEEGLFRLMQRLASKPSKKTEIEKTLKSTQQAHDDLLNKIKKEFEGQFSKTLSTPEFIMWLRTNGHTQPAEKLMHFRVDIFKLNRALMDFPSVVNPEHEGKAAGLSAPKSS